MHGTGGSGEIAVLFQTLACLSDESLNKHAIRRLAVGFLAVEDALDLQ